MPFTPFHMGPGIFFKAFLQGSFSLMVFGCAQIVMDIQPLIVLLSGKGHLHGFSHTFIGATLLAGVSALTGKYLSEFGLKIIGISKKENPIKIHWWIAVLSALSGTYSHVVLDSIMHYDIEPFYPVAISNPLLRIISADSLYRFCVYSGLVGAFCYYLIQFLTKKIQK